jgi:hypothetical protein
MSSLTARPKQLIRTVRDWWQRPLLDVQHATLAAAQRELVHRYRDMAARGEKLPDLSEAGFRVFCDADEDGLLLYIFAVLGTGSRILVDIGAASHSASNTANLLIHHGWTGLLVDADPSAIAAASRFYATSGATRPYPPKLVNTFVTAENINQVLQDNGIVGEIDLLSIDVDGIDIWLWRAIEVIRPRVVIIEFQDILGSDRSVAVPYSPDFRVGDYPENSESNDYAGASLTAMAKVGREKGYRLVGANRLGFNALFVADGLGHELLPGKAPAECLTHPWNAYGQAVRYPRVSHMPWVPV